MLCADVDNSSSGPALISDSRACVVNLKGLFALYSFEIKLILLVSVLMDHRYVCFFAISCAQSVQCENEIIMMLMKSNPFLLP